eukprot:g5247.t1
MDFLSK